MSNINKVKHYNRGSIEVIDFIEDQELNFSRGNVIKYLCRAGHKDEELQDLEKALYYLQREVNRVKNDK